MGLRKVLNPFRYVKISEFYHPIFHKKNIGTFNVPMQNFEIMQNFKPSSNLNEETPALLFREVFFISTFVPYFGQKIPIISILHHNTEYKKGY